MHRLAFDGVSIGHDGGVAAVRTEARLVQAILDTDKLLVRFQCTFTCTVLHIELRIYAGEETSAAIALLH